MEQMRSPVVRAVVVVAIVALGVAVYSLVVNLGLQSEVEQLRGELEATRTELATARGDVGAMSAGVVQQNTTIDELLARVSALETLTSPLDQVMNFLRATFPDLEI
ncbi:MAG: hypothetical protein JSW65_08155 [Candidatus Bipolaricaulota bacterium]|nr:MAG: hypothetical protein JSW65_08155 [Candidatus Bipolaricaulota bacterium]